MKKTFCMDDVRDMLAQLQAEEISMSKALEMLNEKTGAAEERAFMAGWRLRASRKGSEARSSWTQWRGGVYSDTWVG